MASHRDELIVTWKEEKKKTGKLEEKKKELYKDTLMCLLLAKDYV